MLEVLRYINTRDQSNVEGVEDILQILSDFKALNAIIVKDVGDGVCGFYTNVYSTDTVYCINAPCPTRREGSL